MSIRKGKCITNSGHHFVMVQQKIQVKIKYGAVKKD
jgi:hypothetical protein